MKIKNEKEENVKGPSLFYTMLEIRTIAELGTLFFALPFLRKVPKGNGQAVMVLPGFLTNDIFTGILRLFLLNRGYSVHGWQLGFNWTYNEYLGGLMYKRLNDLYETYNSKIILVGWSLGGIYSLVLANLYPELIHMVITLGSPTKIPEGTLVVKIYRFMSRLFSGEIEKLDPEIVRFMQTTPPVPTTSIWSKTDGIVPWQHCVIEETAWTENIEVSGSHCGLGHNSKVLKIIGNRLAQTEEAWQPFKNSELESSLIYTPLESFA